MKKAVEVWRATTSDCELVTKIITGAFADDPLWSHAMVRADGTSEYHGEFWRIFIEGALHNSWTWVAGWGEAASVWIPPARPTFSWRRRSTGWPAPRPTSPGC